MAIRKVFVLKDDKTGNYQDPLFVLTSLDYYISAYAFFEMNKDDFNARDYSVYNLGEFDSDTALFVDGCAPTFVCNAGDLSSLIPSEYISKEK
ncbi:MAG: hypothetical protein [Microviridae sp.]|nr:MAG: hypothetical protein [Microviridae sp.]